MKHAVKHRHINMNAREMKKRCESKRAIRSVAQGDRDCTYMVKHLKEFGAGLVNGADDGTTPAGQFLQQRDALEA